MAAQVAGPAVLATAAARSAIAHLRTVVGPVMFVQYAGYRRATVPRCLPLGEYLPGVRDLLLGEIDSCPYYVNAAHYAARGRPMLVLDVQAGLPEGFSLAAGDGLEFQVRTALTSVRPGSTPRGNRSPSKEGESAMKAAVVTDFRKPLEIQELPVPEPGPGQVLVRMETSGVCHTDIHAAHGDWPVKPTLPFIPGHEGIGIVEAVGPGGSLLRVGERVAIAWLGSACGNCRYCRSGWETLCESQTNSGYSVNGAYAEYAVASADYVVPVPDSVSTLDAAPLTCAGVTTYKAVKVAGVRSAELVAVFGIGGLGHLAQQYARIAGGFVVAVDVETKKLDLATQLGADHVVNARTQDPVKAIQQLGGADVAIVLATTPVAFDQALHSLRRGGRLICVALPAGGTLNVPIFETVLGGLSILGSIVGTRNDLQDVFLLHEAGRTQVVASGRKLDDVNACFDDVLAGRVPARLVFEF